MRAQQAGASNWRVALPFMTMELKPPAHRLNSLVNERPMAGQHSGSLGTRRFGLVGVASRGARSFTLGCVLWGVPEGVCWLSLNVHAVCCT